MRLRDCHNFHDFRRLAKRRLPGPIFDYIDGGADDEVTLRRNTASFERCDLLPNVLRYTPGTTALWDPWHGIRNGKGLFEETSDSFTRMVINEHFSTGLTQPGPILDYFPYLSEPPE